jgi:D-glycero-D-manno-heptose 1,7-bisphosphate phosphatase
VSGSSRPAAFLDRDGTILTEKVYLADPDGVRLLPGAVDAMHRLREAGFALVVVTNQSGIAKGLYELSDYEAVAARVDQVLTEHGMVVDATYFCPHHPDETGVCGCRKPDTGMHRRAAEELDLDLGSSFYGGDKVTDVLPALELGGQGILVRTGYGADLEDMVPPETWIVDDLNAAATRIVGHTRR